MKLRGLISLIVLSTTLTLPLPAETVTGQVTDENGQPLAGVDLDFFESATGDEFKPNAGDLTGPNGVYLVTDAPPGVYDVFFIPPAGQGIAGHQVLNVAVSLGGPAVLLDAVLPFGWFVSGTVLRADTGGPALGVDLDFVDLSTGQKLFTPADNTNVLGIYNVLVPRGIYEVSFDGPEPSLPSDPPQLAHGVVPFEVSVDGSGGVSLPLVVLPRGYHVEGQVRDDQGDAIAGCDLDFRVAGTNQEIFTKQDNSNGTGFYDTLVPAGTYDIEFDPPAGVLAAAKLRTSVIVTADRVLGFETLVSGRALSGGVVDPLGQPLQAVDLDLALTSSGTPIPTALDRTDAAGNYSIRVPAGTYNVSFDPQLNLQVDSLTLSGVGVAFDTLLPDVTLPYHDADADGVSDRFDVCPFADDASQLDSDGDGVGNACDNCRLAANPRQEDNDLDHNGNACDPDDDDDGLLDGVDPDVDGDGIANGLDNCPGARNHEQYDTIAGGGGDACDAGDGEVEYLEAWNDVGFSWRSEVGATRYQAYRQRLDWLSRVNYGVCVHVTTGGTAFVDPELPALGSGFAYVVTATTPAGEGSMGRTDDGTPRPNLRACP